MKLRTLIAGLTTLAAATLGQATAVNAGDHPVPIKGPPTFEIPYQWVGYCAPGVIRSVTPDTPAPTPHLGMAVWHEDDCMVLGPNMTGTYSGHGTITAANGDQLFYDVVDGRFAPNPDGTMTLVTTGTNVITGGTGRFVGATGEMWFTALIIPSGPGTGSIAGHMEGEIVYDASNRAA